MKRFLMKHIPVLRSFPWWRSSGVQNRFIIGILLFAVVSAAYVWLQLFWPVAPTVSKAKAFTIKEGQSAGTVATELERRDLIRSPRLFGLYARITGNTRSLKAGVYRLSPSMTPAQILYRVTSGEGRTIRVTLQEGLDNERMEQRIAEACTKYGVSCQPEFDEVTAATFRNEFSFLQNIPADANLEGFFFPDTYEFAVSDTAEDMAWRMLRNFERNVATQFEEDIENSSHSFHEIVIMASLLEREVPTLKDKKIVAGILWKRRRADMPLQVDATLAEVTGRGSRYLTKQDLQMDHPYNTYQNTGLPPGPIANPGQESIRAALHPTETEYWYYLSKPNGETVFSESLYQHNLARQRWLN